MSPPDSSPLSDSTEAALTDLLAALEAGEDLEAALARWPDKADTLRHALLGGDATHPVSFLEPEPIRVPGFESLRLLGRGGMGEVWLVRRERDDAALALKFVRSADLTPDRRVRIRREAEALAALEHPGIVRVHETGDVGGAPWIAMEFVAGRGLDRVLTEDGPGLRETLELVRDVARALGHAHAAGIVHRDVKPANILVTPEGRVVLIDFGLTRGVEASSLSKTGGFVGTPHYAAPEQVRGERHAVGPATDVFALGVMLYEAVSGRKPFEARSVESLFFQILTEEPPSLRGFDRSLPRDLETVVERSLEKQPGDRYANAEAFAADLDALLDLRPVRARPPSLRRRLRRWRRRQPRLSWGLILAAATIVIIAAVLGLRRVADRAAAEDEVQRGRELLETWQAGAEGLPERRALHEERSRHFERSHQDAEAVRAFNAEERALDFAVRERARIFAEVADALRRADDLYRGAPGSAHLRAQLDVERWRTARHEHRDGAARLFARRVRDNAGAGTLRDVVAGSTQLWIEVDPPGARVDAFVLRRHDRLYEDGEPRLVPVPWRVDKAPGVGALTLVVRRGEGEVRAGDLITHLDGRPVRREDWRLSKERGSVLSIRRNGEMLALSRPDGLVLRPTLTPLLHGPDSYLGNAPLRGLPIAADRFTLLIRAPGYEPLRLTRLAWKTSATNPLRIRLVPVNRHPPEFRQILAGQRRVHFVADREVTLREFRAYLDSPAASLALANKAIDAPFEWTRDENGRFQPHRSRDPDAPAHGLSWRTARAYVAWCNEQLEQEGAPYRYGLPDHGALQAISRDNDPPRRFPWGDHFRPGFTKSCFAAPEPSVEPVFSYPVDETPCGLYDMVGSVSELANGWFWEAESERPVCGGSWVYANPIHFELEFMAGTAASAARSFYGLRLELLDPTWTR